jgi:diguanylate cyclase (GGDEF)-like protein
VEDRRRVRNSEALDLTSESAGPARILVVDDHPDNLTILRDRLEARGYVTTAARDGEEALAALGALEGETPPDDIEFPDLILLDVMLPKIDGFEVARRIKANRRLPFIPVIMQTALDSTADKVVGLDAGADDYITKPINFDELEARMRSLLRIKLLQSKVERQKGELEAINDQLVRIAQTDALTGIDNRRRLDERLSETFAHSVRLAEPFAVVMCDLDRFKSVNDTYGHQAGDAVLQQFARLLEQKARGVDWVGRYGGEEFLIILPGASAPDARAVADRVRRAVEACTFTFDDIEIRRTMSCGVAAWPHSRLRDVGSVVRAADDALYRAKADGRNRVVQWDESIDSTAVPATEAEELDGTADTSSPAAARAGSPSTSNADFGSNDHRA